MLNSEKIAIAAHLHVLLRRKTGRVTDTEWMASNAAYASEIVRFARTSAQADGHADLALWADKLELAMAGPAAKVPAAGLFFESAVTLTREPASSAGAALVEPSLHRYVRGIR